MMKGMKKNGEAVLGTSVLSKPGGVPLIGKKSNLRSLYKFSPEATNKTPEKKGVVFTEPSEPAPKKPKITVKPFKTSVVGSEKDKEAVEGEKEKTAENERRAEEEKRKDEEEKRKCEEDRKKKVEEEKRRQTEEEKKKAKEAKREGGSGRPAGDEAKRTDPELEVMPAVKTSTVNGSGSSSSGKQGAPPYSPIGPRDTLGDIYYKSYTEESRGDALHQPPWGLKQKDTFVEFAPCRDWFLNSIPPREVDRQRARTHSGLYHAYVVGEANTRATNHQIVREWRTLVRERDDWEKYRERMLRRVNEFEKSEAAFDEEKTKFEADGKSEELGREGLKGKLRAAEELLAKEKAKWKKIYERDNQRAYAARAKIVELEGKVADLTAKVEDAQVAKEQIEIELAEVKAQLSSKDKDLKAKDVEIAELKRHLQEQIDKSKSLEIDLGAEKVKATIAEEAKQKAEEARDISTTALNVAQNNYSEAQSIVDTLVSEAEWLRGREIFLMANSILNARELDTAVATLIDASRAVGQQGGYLECAHHATKMFGQEFDTSHCSVTDQAEDELTRAEHSYDHLSIPVMDLVTEALKDDDWCQRLKTILDPPETVEVSDEEPAGGDGEGDDGGGDGDQPE
ncbi:putative transcription factor bZIP family [Helianthus anomalus]